MEVDTTQVEIDPITKVEPILEAADLSGSGGRIMVSGIEYKSYRAVADAFGISHSTFKNRRRKGFTAEQAVTMSPMRVRKPHNLEINGVRFNTIKQAAQHYGVDASVVCNRLARDWTIRQALGLEEPPLWGFSDLGSYGITPAEWLLIWNRQGRKCDICRRSDPGKHTWCVDHCHTSGRVRGILCWSCNVGMGHFQDNSDRMRAAIAYLEKHQSRAVGSSG